MQNEMQSQNPDGQRETVPDTAMPAETATAIRRYIEIQREMALLEQEKEDLRNLIAKELDGQVPASWRPMLDAKPLRLHPRRLRLRHPHRCLIPLPRQALMKLSVILMLAASAVYAAPVVSCRMGLGERGTFRIARDWLLVCGPGEATNDGIPKWTVEVVRESDKDDNRLLPNQWHGLMPCEVAPALVKTNYTHLMAVRGGPWIVRLGVEDVKVRNGRLVSGEAQVDVFPRFDKPVRAPSGTELLLRQAPDGGVPDLRIRRNGVENSLGLGALLSFFGGWNADAWVDAVAFTNILGNDGFAVTVSADGRRKTRYYAESSGSLRTLATSWGREDAHLDPLSGWEDFAVDLDGDGIRELVCQHDDTHVHESERNGRACRVVRIYRCRKGIVEICDDLSPLLDEPDRSVPKVATSWEWLPHSGKVGLVYETGGGKRHVLELCPDLTRLSFRPVTVDGY